MLLKIIPCQPDTVMLALKGQNKADRLASNQPVGLRAALNTGSF